MIIPKYSIDEAIVSDIADLGLSHTVYILREAWGDRKFTENQTNITFKLIDALGVKDIYSEAVYETRASSSLRGHFPAEEAKNYLFSFRLKPSEYIALASELDFVIHAGDDQELYNKQEAAMKASMELSPQITATIKKIKDASIKHITGELDSAISEMIDAQLAGFKTVKINRLIDLTIEYCRKNEIPMPEELKGIVELLVAEKEQKKFYSKFEAEVEKLYSDVLSALSNDDPEEKEVENVIASGLSKFLLTNDTIAASNIVGESDDSLYSVYQSFAKQIKARLEEDYAAKEKDLFKFAETLMNAAECMDVDASSKTIKDFVKYASISHYLKTKNIEVLDSIQQFQHQLILKALHDSKKVAAYQFLVDLTSIDFLVRNQLSPIEQKRSLRLLHYNSAFVDQELDRLGSTKEIRDYVAITAEIWDMALERTKRFYHFAKKREDFVVESIAQLFKEQGKEEKTVLLNMGAFHADYLQRELSRKQIANSLFITPKGSGIDFTKMTGAYQKLFK